MSSLQRTRSLHKPTRSLAEEPAASTAHASSRSASPSRLPVKPVKPSTRPTSVYAPVLDRSTSLSSKKQKAPAAQDPVKKESRHPPLSSAHRPASVVVKTRPTSAGGGGGGPSASHIRAKSTVTSLSAATALRPPSRGERRSAGATSNSTRTVRGRSASADKGPSTPGGKQHTTMAPSAAAEAEAAKPRLRPAFSTLQQHYSPAKAHNPKPLTSAILAPPSPSRLPANMAASAETSRLQAELVQLHLLHRDARAVQSQWQASAKQKLGTRFDKLSRESACIAAREASALEGDNVLALRKWARRGGKDIEDKMQALGEIMTNLWTLSEPAGRHARVVRRFERFVDGVCDAEEARQSTEKTKTKTALASHDALFIGELDDSWREEVAALTRRLEAWREELSSIDDLDSGSSDSDSGRGGASKPSLDKMLSGARELISGMLAELYAMGEIEQQALAREHAWIESMNREGEDELEHDTPRAGAVWRVL